MIITKRILIFTFFITTFYLFFMMYLMNISLMNTIIIGKYPMVFKIQLFSELLKGGTTVNNQNLLTITNAALTGFTFSLIIERLRMFKKLGDIHIVAGGSVIFGIVSGGCISCGLPLISLVGLSGTLLFLPFKGAELPYISLLLLLLSAFLLMRSSSKEVACEIPRKDK